MAKCVHCGVEISFKGGNLWHDAQLVFPQYCRSDSKGRGNLHEPVCESQPVPVNHPYVVPLEAYPANCNPFRHDACNMGCQVSGAWVAMYSQHAGLKQEHNKTDEEKASTEPVYYDDPEYIIMVNTKTGQRFKIVFPDAVKERKARLSSYDVADADS
jgi:hypothetical protein